MTFLHRWFRGRELSRVEVVQALFDLPPAIRPEKPKVRRKVTSIREWILYQEEQERKSA